MKKKAIFSCVFYFSSFIGKVLCLREKRAKQLVMPSRRLQAKGEMSALQMGKYTKIMREVYQSSCFNDKSALRKCEINLILTYVSVKSKLQHAPPPGKPPRHLTFLKIIDQIPSTRAKMPFKCPTLGSIQLIKCPHPGDISQAQK